jgi:hypothetical protein
VSTPGRRDLTPADVRAWLAQDPGLRPPGRRCDVSAPERPALVVYAEGGRVEVELCDVCAALVQVEDRERHARWHMELARTAELAYRNEVLR